MEIDRTAKNEELVEYLQKVMEDLRQQQSVAFLQVAEKLQSLFGASSVPDVIPKIEHFLKTQQSSTSNQPIQQKKH